MNPISSPRKFALSCTLSSLVALATSSGAVTPGGTFGDKALIIESTGGETLAVASGAAGLGAPVIHDFDTGVSVDATYELDPSAADATQIALSAGRHLVMYDTRFNTTAGANRSEMISNLTLDGSPLAIGRSQGYLRRLGNNDDAVMSGGGIITVASDDDILTLETRRSDTNPDASVVPTRAANGTAIQLLKLDDSWDYLNVQRSTNQGGAISTTATNVIYDVDNSPGTHGTAFTFSTGTGNVILNEPGSYLVFANTRLEKPVNNTRTNYQQFLTLDGTEIEGTRTTTYIRGSANGENAHSGITALGTIISAAPGDTLNVKVVMESGGSASTIRADETALTIVKLPIGAKTISLTDSTNQEVNNAVETPITFDTTLGGSTTFSHTLGDSLVTVNDTDDYLFFGTVFTQSDATNDNQDRIVPLHGWQLDGSGGRIARGRGAAYNRDSSGNRTSGSWGGLIASLASGQTVELTSQSIANSDLGASSEVSLKGLSVSSLLPNNDPAIAINLPIEIVPSTTSVITNSFLNTVDNDTVPSGLTYTVTSAPTAGTLSHSVNGSIGLNGTFTQEDIDNGNIEFTAAGTPSLGGFDFSVSDGSTAAIGSFVVNAKFPDATVTIVSDGDVTEGAFAGWTLTSTLAPTGSNLTVNINYSGSASDGSDFTGVASVDIPVGATTADLDVITLTDGVFEGCESLIATIDSFSGGELNASAGAADSAFVIISDGGNSNPVGSGLSQIVIGTGTVPLNDIVAFDPDATYASSIVTAGDPLVTFGGLGNLSVFSDARSPDDASFDLDGSGPALNQSAGFSIEVELSVQPADLTGTVDIWEIGGSSNGTALLLVEGVPHLLIKSGGGPGDFPTDDGSTVGVVTDLDWAGDDTVMVPLSTTSLVPGNPARIAAIYSNVGVGSNTVTYSVNGTAGSATLINNDAANWVGDHTFNVGVNAGSGTGGSSNVAGNLITDADLKNPAEGQASVSCLKFWNESTGSITSSPGVVDQITATLTIDNYNPGIGDLTATSGNGETYAAGVWAVTGDPATVNAALAAVEFIAGASPVDPTIILVSLEDGNEDGGGPETGTIIISGAVPSVVYVDDDLAGTANGTSIPDADGGSPVAPATMSLDAFASIADALAAVEPLNGTIVVNDGDYSSESVALLNSQTLRLTDTGAGTVTLNTITTGSVTATLDLGSETLVVGGTNAGGAFDGPISGSGNLTKNGTGRIVLRNLMSYSGTTTVNDGFLRLGYESSKVIFGNWDGDGPIVVNAPGVLEFNCGNGYTQTQTGVISGDGEVRKIDNGTLIFDGPSGNTFTGTFELGDGAGSTFNGTNGNIEGFVVVNHNDHLGAGLVLSRGGQLQAGTTGIVIPNDIDITNGGFRIGGTNDFEFSGNIAPIENSNRGFGNYGLSNLDLTISGNIDNTNGNISFEGSNGQDNGTWTVTGDISGTGQVIVQSNFSNGQVTLSGINTYSGATLVNTTTALSLDGTHTGGGDYTINGTAVLGGSGSTDSAVTIAAAATLDPGGNGIGTLATGTLTLDGSLVVDVDNTAGSPGTDWDSIEVTGTVTLNSATLVVNQSATVEDPPSSISILSNNDIDGISGSFAVGVPFSSDYLGSGLAGDVTLLGGDGNDVDLITGSQSIIGSWRNTNFGSPANSGNGANNSDAGDLDGLVNFLEFAFGTDPNTADQFPLDIVNMTNGVPTVDIDFSGPGVEFSGVFSRRKDFGQSGSLNYIPQFSSDLVTWHDSSGSPTIIEATTDDPDYEIVGVPYPFFTPDGKKARYFRVKIESTL